MSRFQKSSVQGNVFSQKGRQGSVSNFFFLNQESQSEKKIDPEIPPPELFLTQENGSDTFERERDDGIQLDDIYPTPENIPQRTEVNPQPCRPTLRDAVSVVILQRRFRKLNTDGWSF